MKNRLMVLVIEDDMINRLLIQNFLGHVGHQIVEAETALAGIKLARETRPDIILLDRKLPDMEGTSVCAILKADPITRRIPVIAVTGLAYEQDFKDSYAAGFDGHIAKPYHWRDLIAMIEKVRRD